MHKTRNSLGGITYVNQRRRVKKRRKRKMGEGLKNEKVVRGKKLEKENSNVSKYVLHCALVNYFYFIY
jgi:hypothetical protein